MAETTTYSQQELQQAAGDLAVLNQILEVCAQTIGRERMVKIEQGKPVEVTPELYDNLAKETVSVMEDAKNSAAQDGVALPAIERAGNELIALTYVNTLVEAGKINPDDKETLQKALFNSDRIITQAMNGDFNAFIAASAQQTQPQNTTPAQQTTPTTQQVAEFTPDEKTKAAMETISKVLPDLGITPSGTTVADFRKDYTTAMEKIAGMMNLQATTPEAQVQEIKTALDKTASDSDFSKIVSGYRFASDAKRRAQEAVDKAGDDASLIEKGKLELANKAFEKVKAGVEFGISKGDDTVLEKVPEPIRQDYNRLFAIVANRQTLVDAMNQISASGLLNPPQAPVVQTASPASATQTQSGVQLAPAAMLAPQLTSSTTTEAKPEIEQKPAKDERDLTSLKPDDPKVLNAMMVIEGKFLSKLGDFTEDFDPSVMGFASKFVDLKPLTEADINDDKFEDVQFSQAMMLFRALGGDKNPSGAYDAEKDRASMMNAITDPKNSKYAAYEMVRQHFLGEGYGEDAVKQLREDKTNDLNALFNAMDTLDRAGLTNTEKAKKDRMANRILTGMSEYLPDGFKNFLKDFFSSGFGKMVAGFLGKAGIQVGLLWGEGRMDDNTLASKGIQDIRDGYKEEYAAIKPEEIPAGKTKLDVMEERVMSKLDSYAVKYVNGALFANASDASIKNAFQASFDEAKAVLEENPKATDEDIMNVFTNRLIQKADELSLGTTGMSLGDRLAQTKEITDDIVKQSGFAPPDLNATAELKSPDAPTATNNTPSAPKITEPTILSQDKGVTSMALSDTLNMTLTFKPNNNAYTQDPLRLSNGRVAAGIQEVFGRNEDKLDLPAQFSPDRMKNAGGRYNDMATQTTCAALEYVFIQAQIHAHYADPANKGKDIDQSSIRQQVKTDADIDMIAKYLKAKGVSDPDVNAFTKNMNSMAEDMGSVAKGQKNQPTTAVLEQSFLHHQFALDFVKIAPKVEVKAEEVKKPEPPPVEIPKPAPVEAAPEVVEEVVREAPVTAIPQGEPAPQPHTRERIVQDQPPEPARRPKEDFNTARQNAGGECAFDTKFTTTDPRTGEVICRTNASPAGTGERGTGTLLDFFMPLKMIRYTFGGAVGAVTGDHSYTASAIQDDINAQYEREKAAKEAVQKELESRIAESKDDTGMSGGYDPVAASSGHGYARQNNPGQQRLQ